MKVIVGRPIAGRRPPFLQLYKRSPLCKRLERAYRAMVNTGIRLIRTGETPEGLGYELVGCLVFRTQEETREDGRKDKYFYFGNYRLNSRRWALAFADAFDEFTVSEVNSRAGLLEGEPYVIHRRKQNKTRIFMTIERLLEDLAGDYNTTLEEMITNGHLAPLVPTHQMNY